MSPDVTLWGGLDSLGKNRCKALPHSHCLAMGAAVEAYDMSHKWGWNRPIIPRSCVPGNQQNWSIMSAGSFQRVCEVENYELDEAPSIDRLVGTAGCGR